MINIVIGFLLYFLVVWGIVDIAQRMLARFKAHMQKQPQAKIEKAGKIRACRVYYDFTFSDEGNHFTISARDRSEAWVRARRLVGEESINKIFLVKVTGPHWEIRHE